MYLSEKEFLCPYCGCPNTISLDAGQGKEYELITDCEVCCRPIIVNVRMIEDDCELDIHGENE